MPELDSRVFDVSKPKASPNSRPVIVGHRPIMADPMVNRPSRPVEMPTSQPPSQAPTHQAKVIEVTDEVRQEVKQATVAEMPAEPPVQPAPEAAAIEPAPVPASEVIPPEVIQPEMAKVELAPAPVALAAGGGEMSLPHMVTSLPHMNSLPVSHESVTSPSRLKPLLGWLVALAFIGLVAAYLAVDAGLVKTSLNLPFHIFSQG